jgi:hypothetical protein
LIIQVSFYGDGDDDDDANVASSSKKDREIILNALNNNYSLVDTRNTSLRWMSFDFPKVDDIAVGAVLTRNQVSILYHNSQNWFVMIVACLAEYAQGAARNCDCGAAT